MDLTRYYHKKRLSSADIRAIRDLLTSPSSFNWALSYGKYSLYYSSQFYSVDSIKEVDQVVQQNGQPDDVRVAFASQGGRMFTLETRADKRITITVDNKEDAPEKILDAIEPLVSLELLGDVRQRLLTSAFVAHGFNEEGTAYANQVARFLALVGIRCQSGRSFSPGSISDKVLTRLTKYDLFFAILTPQEDFTWVTQEIATASALRKDVFILKESGVTLKQGILGDHEHIPFDKGHIPTTFIPILEGLNELRGIENGILFCGTMEPDESRPVVRKSRPGAPCVD